MDNKKYFLERAFKVGSILVCGSPSQVTTTLLAGSGTKEIIHLPLEVVFFTEP